jgi:hypothetical protein
MADETRLITQEPDARFRVEHDGQRPDADGCVHPIRHDARIVHEGREELPFVHIVQMRQDEPCGVRTSGELAHVGDPERPVPLEMRHSSPHGPVEIDLRVRQAQHELRVSTDLQDPMHHALQLKTPLQVRFVNPWTAQSDYRVSVTLGNRQLLDVRIAGQTILTPRPAPPDSCTDASLPRVRPVVDLLGKKDSNDE